MSSKLDKSLDEITGGRRNNPRGSRRGGKPAVVAGGVSKKTATRPAKAAARPAAPAVQTRGDSKIIVSNLVSSQYVCNFVENVLTRSSLA